MQKNVKVKNKEKVIISVLVLISLVFLLLAINASFQKQMALAQVGSLKADMVGLNGLLRKFSRSHASLKETSQKLERLIGENASLKKTLSKAQLVNQTLKAGLEEAKASLEGQALEK